MSSFSTFNSKFSTLKTFLFNKEVLIFLLFAALSTGFWYVQNLYEKGEFDFHIPLTYSNIPLQYVSPEDLPASLELTLTDVGATLLSYRFRGLDSLQINLQHFYQEGSQNIIIPMQLLVPDIRRKLRNSTEIVKFRETQFVIPLIEQQEKTLSVMLNADISYSQQYILSGEITLTPSVVTVYGPKNIVDTLSSVSTQHIKFENLNSDTRRQVPLQQIKSVRMMPGEISVHIPVETFTEQSLELHIVGKNLPGNISVLPFPSTVRVLYFVGLSHINDVDSSAFEVFFDYNDLKNGDSDRLPLQLTVKNPYLQNVRLVPNAVEYLIEK